MLSQCFFFMKEAGSLTALKLWPQSRPSCRSTPIYLFLSPCKAAVPSIFKGHLKYHIAWWPALIGVIVLRISVLMLNLFSWTDSMVFSGLSSPFPHQNRPGNSSGQVKRGGMFAIDRRSCTRVDGVVSLLFWTSPRRRCCWIVLYPVSSLLLQCEKKN